MKDWGRRLWERAVARWEPARYGAIRKERDHLRRLLDAADREILDLRIKLAAAIRPGPTDLPGLTAAQIERLAMLAEECGEIVQAACKVLRHGWRSTSPFGGKPNNIALERELGDLRAVSNLMVESGDLRAPNIGGYAQAKQHTMSRWTHHQANSDGAKGVR